jgi:hypothetical protein
MIHPRRPQPRLRQDHHLGIIMLPFASRRRIDLYQRAADAFDRAYGQGGRLEIRESRVIFRQLTRWHIRPCSENPPCSEPLKGGFQL